MTSRWLLPLAGLLVAGAAPAPAQQREIADEYRVAGLDDRRFDHATYWAAVEAALASDRDGRVRLDDLGRSVEGRTIRALTVGEGPVSVLLWSQMHGDESGASMALADIAHWFAASPEDDARRRLLGERLTITMIPMLNPDGAERFIRHNALGVDINRDARRLATPEGRILRAVRDSLEADFGFNLHDQGSRSAGPGGDLVAIALLAPAADEERSWGPVRQRARHLSAAIAQALAVHVPGRIARYDDEFAPRAFGDNIQMWGTSTVLIESGAMPDDPQKQAVRRLNVVALVAAFEAIAGDSLEAVPTAAYDDLPMNEGVENELLLVGGLVVLGDREPYRLDIGIAFEDAVARTGPTYAEIGDMADATSVETIDLAGSYIHVTPGEEGILRRGDPVRLVVRHGPGSGSEEVFRLQASEPDPE